MSIGAPTTDPRSQRTVARLQRALGELMRSQSLSQISVSELCRTAGVHRTTFYKHYVSVSDFARAAFGALLDQALAPRPDPGPDVLTEYRASMVQLLEQVAAQRETFRHLMGPEGDLVFQRVIGDHLTSRARSALEAAELGSPDSRPVAATVLGFAALGLVERWAMGDDEDSGAAADAYFAVVSPWGVAAGGARSAEPRRTA